MTLQNKIGRVVDRLPMLNAMFRRFIWSRVHFPESEMRWLNSLKGRPFDVAIDVGAAQGYFSWILSRKSNFVFAFEPGRALSRLMMSGSRLSNIQFFRAAAGETCGNVLLYTPKSGIFGATVSKESPVPHTAGVVADEIIQVTLDEAVQCDGDQHVDFIKIDVEGYESSVLKGGRGIINQYKPILLVEIEIRHNPNYQVTFRMLNEWGYKCYVRKSGRFVAVSVDDVASLQKIQYLTALESGSDRLGDDAYLNNFIFLHPGGRINPLELK